MHKIRVGVLYGGPSREHDVSLETGKAMLEHLPDRYEGVDVFVDRDGQWHVNGKPIRLDQLSDYVDVVLNGMHGEYGEDGTVQRQLDKFGIPYTGAGSVQSATAFNKEIAKSIFNQYGIKTVVHVVLTEREATDERFREIFNTHPAPYVVKPVSAGSSVGASIARTLPELTSAVRKLFEQGFDRVMIEEYIKGREGTCGIVDDLRGEQYYALPLIEIIPPDHAEFFDYTVKYNGETKEICPGNFTREEKKNMENAARTIHKALGLRHYSRTDFIVSPRGIYVLEVNTLPGMTPESLFPKALAAIGVAYDNFLEHLVKLAYRHA